MVEPVTLGVDWRDTPRIEELCKSHIELASKFANKGDYVKMEQYLRVFNDQAPTSDHIKRIHADDIIFINVIGYYKAFKQREANVEGMILKGVLDEVVTTLEEMEHCNKYLESSYYSEVIARLKELAESSEG